MPLVWTLQLLPPAIAAGLLLVSHCTGKGYPTAVSFFDSTGQPWPIQWDTNSNPAAIAGGTNCSVDQRQWRRASRQAIGFYVCTPTKGSNVLEITPVSLAPRGGLVVSLEGAPKPIAFLLVAGGGRYDANLSVHVADRGPHAKVEIMTQPDAPDTGAPFLTGMLQGVPPADAVPLRSRACRPRASGPGAWAAMSICAPATRCSRRNGRRPRPRRARPSTRCRTRRSCCCPSTAGPFRPR